MPCGRVTSLSRQNYFVTVSVRVSVSLDQRAFMIWSTTANKWTVARGSFGVLVGDSSVDLPLKSSVSIQ